MSQPDNVDSYVLFAFYETRPMKVEIKNYLQLVNLLKNQLKTISNKKER